MCRSTNIDRHDSEEGEDVSLKSL